MPSMQCQPVYGSHNMQLIKRSSYVFKELEDPNCAVSIGNIRWLRMFNVNPKVRPPFIGWTCNRHYTAINISLLNSRMYIYKSLPLKTPHTPLDNLKIGKNTWSFCIDLDNVTGFISIVGVASYRFSHYFLPDFC